MNKYLLTSKLFKGAVEFTFNESGLLVSYLVDAELAERTLLFVLRKLPREEAFVNELVKDVPELELKRLQDDLSFERFWNEYEKKIHAIRVEPLWKKLSDNKKLAALKAIGPYNGYLSRTGVAKVNPENYIKKQYWLNDWKNER